jgi:hypothetical protein
MDRHAGRHAYPLPRVPLSWSTNAAQRFAGGDEGTCRVGSKDRRLTRAGAGAVTVRIKVSQRARG